MRFWVKMSAVRQQFADSVFRCRQAGQDIVQIEQRVMTIDPASTARLARLNAQWCLSPESVDKPGEGYWAGVVSG